jgi:hypothetical protein
LVFVLLVHSRIRLERRAADIIGCTIVETQITSELPLGEAITVNVIPGILQANVLLLAIGVGDQYTGMYVLVAAEETTGRSGFGSFLSLGVRERSKCDE